MQFNESIFIASNKSEGKSAVSPYAIGYGDRGTIFAVNVAQESIQWLLHLPSVVPDQRRYYVSKGLVDRSMLYLVLGTNLFHVDLNKGALAHTTSLAGERCRASEFFGGIAFDHALKRLYVIDVACVYMIDERYLLTQVVLSDLMEVTMKPVLFAGSLYVGDTTGKMHCFEASTLKERWAVKVDPVGYALKGIVTYGTRMYTYSSEFAMEVDPASGKVVNLFSAPVRYLPPPWKRAADHIDSLAVFNGTVHITGSNYYYALSLNLQMKWQWLGDCESSQQCQFIHLAHLLAERGVVVISTTPKGLRDGTDILALDAATGTVAWDAPSAVDDSQCYRVKEVLDSDAVLLDCYAGIIAISAVNGSLLSVVMPGAQDDSSMHVVGDHVVVASNSNHTLTIAPISGGHLGPAPTLSPPSGTLPPDSPPATLPPVPEYPPNITYNMAPMVVNRLLALPDDLKQAVAASRHLVIGISSRKLYGVNLQNGSVVWEAAVDDETATLMLDPENTMYFYLRTRVGLQQYDLTGTLRWTAASVPKDDHLQVVSSWVIVVGAGQLTLLSVHDGSERFVYRDPIIVADGYVLDGMGLDGSSVVFTFASRQGNYSTFALNTTSKSLLWKRLWEPLWRESIIKYSSPYIVCTGGATRNASVVDATSGKEVCAFPIPFGGGDVVLMREGSQAVLAAVDVESHWIQYNVATCKLIRDVPFPDAYSMKLMPDGALYMHYKNHGQVTHVYNRTGTLLFNFTLASGHFWMPLTPLRGEPALSFTGPFIPLWAQSDSLVWVDAAEAAIVSFVSTGYVTSKQPQFVVFVDPELGPSVLIVDRKNAFVLPAHPRYPVRSARTAIDRSRGTSLTIASPFSMDAAVLATDKGITTVSFTDRFDFRAVAMRASKLPVTSYIKLPPNLTPFSPRRIGDYIVMLALQDSIEPHDTYQHPHFLARTILGGANVVSSSPPLLEQLSNLCGGDADHLAVVNEKSVVAAVDGHHAIFAAETECLYMATFDKDALDLTSIKLDGVVTQPPIVTDDAILAVDNYAFMYSYARGSLRRQWKRNFGYFPGTAVSSIVVLPRAPPERIERAVVVTGGFVVCLDTQSGAMMWSEYVPVASALQSVTLFAALKDEAVLVVAVGGTGCVMSAVHTGFSRPNRSLWVKSCNSWTIVRAETDGSASNPLTYKNTFFVTGAHTITRVDLWTGREIWRAPTPCSGGAMLHSVNGTQLLYAFDDGKISILDPETGSVLQWMPYINEDTSYSNGMCVAGAEGILCTVGRESVVLLGWTPAATPTKAPEKPTDRASTLGPVLAIVVAVALIGCFGVFLVRKWQFVRREANTTSGYDSMSLAEQRAELINANENDL